jgi:transcription factor 1
VYQKIMTEHIYPDDKPVNTENSQFSQLNESLLVTGSLIFDPMLPGLSFSSLVKQLIVHFVETTLTRGTFHVHGPARMLFWTNEEDIMQSVPRVVVARSKFSTVLERLSTITQVVMPEVAPISAGRSSYSRDPATQLESARRVVENAGKMGFVLPTHRRSGVHDFLEDYCRMTDGGKKPVLPSVLSDYLKEQYVKGKPTPGLLGDSVQEILSAETTGQSHFTKTKLAQMRASVSYLSRAQDLRWHVSNIGEEIYRVECETLRTSDEKKRKELQQRLDILEKEYEAGVDGLTELNRDRLSAEIDDRIAVRQPSPVLGWESRPFEPLTIHSGEVWPARRTGLMDIVPKPIPDGNAAEDFEYFKDLLMPLYDYPRTSLPKALEGVSPGASELIKEIPMLRDPALGGRLNMDNLRVRMLTPDMIDALSKAFRGWLFRPPGLDHPNFFRAKWSATHLW